MSLSSDRDLTDMYMYILIRNSCTGRNCEIWTVVYCIANFTKACITLTKYLFKIFLLKISNLSSSIKFDLEYNIEYYIAFMKLEWLLRFTVIFLKLVLHLQRSEVDGYCFLSSSAASDLKLQIIVSVLSYIIQNSKQCWNYKKRRDLCFV